MSAVVAVMAAESVAKDGAEICRTILMPFLVLAIIPSELVAVVLAVVVLLGRPILVTEAQAEAVTAVALDKVVIKELAVTAFLGLEH